MQHYLECMLVFKSYKPLHLEKGMWFISTVNGQNLLRELTEIPRDTEEWLLLNGYPVEPYIININNINLMGEDIITQPEHIGWYDEGDHSDELSDITIKNINDILTTTDGLIDVQMIYLEEEDAFIPEYIEGKVVIRMAQEEEYEENDDDDDELNEEQ